LSFRLTQPASDVLSPEDLEATMEGEFSQKFRRALNTLVEEMLEAAEDVSAPRVAYTDSSKLRGVFARTRGDGEGDGDENNPSRGGDDGGSGVAGGNSGGGEIDMDSAIYRTFISHHRPPCDVFPFPYLTPDDFSNAVVGLVITGDVRLVAWTIRAVIHWCFDCKITW
jgi:hypothetical protein